MKTKCECGCEIEYGVNDIKNAHRLLCGNSENLEDVKKVMNGQFCKLIITSPPYNANAGFYENYKDNMKSDDFIRFNLKVIENCKRYLRGFVFLNLNYNRNSRSEFIEIVYQIIKTVKLQFLELIIWNKKASMPIVSNQMLTRQFENVFLFGDGDSIREDLEIYFCGKNQAKVFFNKKTNRGITNYWELGTNKTQLKNLTACFPVSVPKRAINLMSQKNDIVLEPFSGSFSTGIACELLGRRCYAIELNPNYVSISLDRWSALTKKDPVRLSDGKKWSEIKK